MTEHTFQCQPIDEIEKKCSSSWISDFSWSYTWSKQTLQLRVNKTSFGKCGIFMILWWDICAHTTSNCRDRALLRIVGSDIPLWIRCVANFHWEWDPHLRRERSHKLRRKRACKTLPLWCKCKTVSVWVSPRSLPCNVHQYVEIAQRILSKYDFRNRRSWRPNSGNLRSCTIFFLAFQKFMSSLLHLKICSMCVF